MARVPTADEIASANARLRGEGFIGMRDTTIVTDKSAPTIRREVRRGDFPVPVRISRGRVAWRAPTLLQWLTERAAPGVSQVVRS